MSGEAPRASVGSLLVMGTILCGATAVLVWIGYRATAEWERSNALVVERRGSEMLALVSAALNRDMKGTHTAILASITLPELLADSPYDLADTFGVAFARFPYPESFFVWRRQARPDIVTWFNRSERPPRWAGATAAAVAYPVLLADLPVGAHQVIDGVHRAASPRGPLVIQHTPIGGTPYQIVARAYYAGQGGFELAGIIGYTVNLQWVREHYFRDMVSQVLDVAGSASDLAVAVLDDRQHPVTPTAVHGPNAVSTARQFPLAFFEPALVTAANRPRGAEPWTIRVDASRDGPAFGADTTRRMFIVTALAAAAAVVGLLLTMRAARATAELAALKSEFVSTVTHEIKTPVAGIALVAETLAMGRSPTPETVREYGTLLSIETRRLTQLIENLLAYARLSDVSQAYSFESLDPGDLVDEALDRCRLRIQELGFTIDNTLPPDLPRVWADRSAIVQALENILDNAVSYAGEQRTVSITGHAQNADVRLDIHDTGPGIAPDELAHVFDKFFRGRHAPGGGSGLGLTISRRIVLDHGGRLEIASTVGRGTTATVVLPARLRHLEGL